MVDVAPAGPIHRIPRQPVDVVDYVEIDDCVLLRPDRAIIKAGNNADLSYPGADGHGHMLLVVNPITGQELHVVGIPFDFNDVGYGSMFRIDDNTAGLMAYGFNSDATESGWVIGTINTSGHFRERLIPAFGAFNPNPVAGYNEFFYKQHKETMYSCWDPHTRQVVFTDWVRYDLDIPYPTREVYATTFSIDTFEPTSQYRIWPSQRSIYSYYESFATTFPGYEGAVGVEVNTGGRDEQPAEDLWLVNNNRERLLRLPLHPTPQTDIYVTEAFIQQVTDDPDCVAVIWIENRYLKNGRSAPPPDSRTSMVIVRLYPKLQVVSNIINVGEFLYDYHFDYDSINEYWANNMYDMPRFISKDYMVQDTSNSFLFGRYVLHPITTDGALIAVRAHGDKPTVFNPYVLKAADAGIGVPGASDYRGQQFLSSVQGDHLFVAGTDYTGNTRPYPSYFQLLKLTARSIGAGNASTRAVTFT